MPSRLRLSWAVNVVNSPISLTSVARELAAVKLYKNQCADPVLGALFGLKIVDDVVTTGESVDAPKWVRVPESCQVTRSLLLDLAPPFFPCHPITATPPKPPYALRVPKELAGAFLTTPGSCRVVATATQLPAIVMGDTIEFASQPGVFYVVHSISGYCFTLTCPYTGEFVTDGKAFNMIPAPTTKVAIYSTSPLDTAGTELSDLSIPAGSGARTVEIKYRNIAGDVTTTTIELQGKNPVVFDADVMFLDNMKVASVGNFGASVGQITLSEISADPAPLPADPTRADFQRQTDATQMLLGRAIAYMPPSFFALAQQGLSDPQLCGDFVVTTGSKNVVATYDQTGALAEGDFIEFAAQMGTFYEIAAVAPKIITLVKPIASPTELLEKVTGAYKLGYALPPTRSQLAAVLGQFVNPGDAAPCPVPPLAPETMTPSPCILSDIFTQTIALALGVAAVPYGGAPTDRPSVQPELVRVW